MTDGEETKPGRDPIEVLTGIAGALTAAAALVVVPGSIVLLMRLRDADLPVDLGVVISLPHQFLIAVGLTYVLFPLILLVALAVLVVLAPGAGEPNPALLRSEIGGAPALWLGVSALILIVGLPLAVDFAPPWWAFGLSVLTALALLAAARTLVRKFARSPGSTGAVALTASVAALFFLPWVMAFAASRGALQPTTVCTADGERFDGVMIGEAGDRIYMGESTTRITVVIEDRSREKDVETALRARNYDVRLADSVSAIGLKRIDLVVADQTALDEFELARLESEGLPLLLFALDPAATVGESSSALVRIEPLETASSARLPAIADELLVSAATESGVADDAGALTGAGERIQPPRRILAIPSSAVTRIAIGGTGFCQPRKVKM